MVSLCALIFNYAEFGQALKYCAFLQNEDCFLGTCWACYPYSIAMPTIGPVLQGALGDGTHWPCPQQFEIFLIC